MAAMSTSIRRGSAAGPAPASKFSQDSRLIPARAMAEPGSTAGAAPPATTMCRRSGHWASSGSKPATRGPLATSSCTLQSCAM